MSYILCGESADKVFAALSQRYDIYAPKRFPAAGRYSDTDVIKYARVDSLQEIEHDTKSTYPMKEVLSPIQQSLFYFTEDEYRASKAGTRPILVFARACDINAMKVQARIYAGNGGFTDTYYERMRDRVKYVLTECDGTDDTCFCVSMNSNVTDDYSIAVRFTADGILAQVRDDELSEYFTGLPQCDFEPKFVTENAMHVTVPDIADRDTLLKLKAHPMWKEFNGRCISCGACTVACSTCTCFTTRDVIYSDNPEVGERRRVTSSCQVHDFADMAGGASYRPTAGDKMRYKVLHKFHDYKARFGDSHMCVGCGRCTIRCPELISITATLEKMSAALEEIKGEGERKNV